MVKIIWNICGCYFFPCVKNEATILLIECDLHPQDCSTRYNILVMVAPPPNQIQLCTLPECPCLNVFCFKDITLFPVLFFYKTDTFCGNIPIMRVSYLKNFFARSCKLELFIFGIILNYSYTEATRAQWPDFVRKNILWEREDLSCDKKRKERINF